MKSKWLLGISVIVLCAAKAFTQDAAAVRVSPGDAKMLKEAWEQYVAADSNWRSVKAEMQKKYTPKEDSSGPLYVGSWRSWGNVHFSTDFSIMLPDLDAAPSFTRPPTSWCVGVTNTTEGARH